MVRVVGLEPTLQWNRILNPTRLPVFRRRDCKWLMPTNVHFGGIDHILNVRRVILLNHLN